MGQNIRRFRLMALLGALAIAGVVALNSHGCSAPPRLTGTLLATEERSRKLTALAAQEAAEIQDVDARLTRQLNLADRQIQNKWLTDGRATLAGAQKALGSEDARKLNDHARISGWISVSELSRLANDDPAALAACEGAVAVMRAIPDPSVRCDYVMGIGNELQYLKGKSAAAELIVEAGPWTKSIDHVERRRQAVVSFAAALFNLDDFERGQRMLRNEPDPGWRSDTLLRLASLPEVTRVPMQAAMSLSPASPGAGSAPVAARDEAPSSLFFGKQLNYRNVFQGQVRSQTQGQ